MFDVGLVESRTEGFFKIIQTLKPAKVAQLVKVNAKMCGRGVRFWVWILPLVKYLNLHGVGCWRSQYPKIWVPIESPKGLAIEGSLVIKNKGSKQAFKKV